MGSVSELACTYAALILADDEVPITADKITTLLKAASVSVEPIWPSLFTKALASIDIKDLITSVGSASSSGPATGAAGGAAAEVVEEKKEEEEEEEEEGDDMGFGLFD